MTSKGSQRWNIQAPALWPSERTPCVAPGLYFLLPTPFHCVFMKTSCYLVYMLCVALVTSLTSSCKHEAIKEGQCAFPDSSLVWAMRPRQRTVLLREVVIPQETSAQWSPQEEGRRSEREMRESCFESLSQHLGSFHQQLGKTLSVWGAGIKAVPS